MLSDSKARSCGETSCLVGLARGEGSPTRLIGVGLLSAVRTDRIWFRSILDEEMAKRSFDVLSDIHDNATVQQQVSFRAVTVRINYRSGIELRQMLPARSSITCIFRIGMSVAELQSIDSHG